MAWWFHKHLVALTLCFVNGARVHNNLHASAQLAPGAEFDRLPTHFHCFSDLAIGMLVSTKSIGNKKPLFADFSVPLPPDWDGDEGGGGEFTLRDLIERVVRFEVEAFLKRQTARQFFRVLTEAEIDDAALKGKIEMGGSEVELQHVDVDQAVASAWEAFEDGLYLVVIDETRYEDLDQRVFVTDKSLLTFIRLTMLSGG